MQSQRIKLVVAVHLFLFKEGKILLLKRYNTGWMDGYYSVPAGHLDRTETVRQSMVREVKEEIGIAVNPLDLEIAHVMHRQSDDERIDFFFTAKKWEGDVKNREADKCDELLWLETDNLPANTIPYIKFAIENFSKNIIYSEFGWPA